MRKILPISLTVCLALVCITSTHSQTQTSSGLMFTSSSSQALASFKDAVQFHDLNENKKAREALQKTIQLDPKLAAGYIYLCYHSSSLQEAEANLQKAKENLSGANEWEKLFYDYTETYLSDNTARRIETAQNMVNQFPKEPRAYQLLGDAFSNTKEVVRARANYEKAIQAEPTWGGGYRSMASSLLFDEPKSFSKAEEHANKLVSLSPTAAGFILLGDVYRAQNDLRKAERTYTRAIDSDPSNPAGYYKRGHTYSFLSQFEKARTDFRQAGKLDVISNYSIQYIANTYLYDDNPSEAIRFLLAEAENANNLKDQVKAMNNRYFFLQDALLIAFHRRDESMLKKILPLMEPLSEKISNSYNDANAKQLEKSSFLFSKALAAIIANDMGSASKLAEEIKTVLAPIQNPRKLEGYEFILGQIAFKQKNYEKAKGHFLKTDLQNPYHKYWLAKAYETTKQKKNTKIFFQELVNYNFNDIGYALIRNEVRKEL